MIQNNLSGREGTAMLGGKWGVVSRSAEQKQVYYPRMSAEAEDACYILRRLGVLIKNNFEV